MSAITRHDIMTILFKSYLASCAAFYINEVYLRDFLEHV